MARKASTRELEIHADYRAKLATENARAEVLRAKHAEITARLEAKRDALFAARWKAAKVRGIARKQLPLPIGEIAA